MDPVDRKQACSVVDSSVVVAALLSWHQQHELALSLLSKAFARGEVVLPSRVLVESFSMMTRMPAPHRVSALDALRLLKENFSARAEVGDFPTDERWSLLQKATSEGWTVGLIYDAEIVETARHRGARWILTLNRKHFERLTPEDIDLPSA